MMMSMDHGPRESILSQQSRRNISDRLTKQSVINQYASGAGDQILDGIDILSSRQAERLSLMSPGSKDTR